ncbi:MAG: glycosyltransferase [Gemmatimonadetes bacterium]|nr:glycosyltransferase [Gemmatimonadota bacterium]NIQ57693.1 glycosyltransferase [Gemmatimonadota bacterium]NIU77860.1 glycosyltransferase [Gammaproteobacteria bacterium]NIX46976.1 glycosyltransferase [Gemmatimonadota bacterium]NIY11334.1 glycosyltransferase [Gemmatimonadota bacterium]
MSALAFGLVGLLAVLTVIALVNLGTAPRLHRLPPPVRCPLVSVLVPARDEAFNLGRTLPALLASRYPALEVVILDDGSSDDTVAVARRTAQGDERVRLVEGHPPPRGWTGKNWACHQLAELARGKVLIFCDADVRPGPDAVARTISALRDTGAGVLTAFPRHDRGGWFEEAVIPVVTKLPVAALLPLALVRWTRTPSLAVGNGQWLAWRREAYERVGGHARVRGDVLEDVRLARVAKAEGVRLAAFVATRDLAVRMYADRRSTWEGFVKNLYPLAGGRPALAFAAVVALLALGPAPILLSLVPGASPLFLVALAELLVLRTAAARLFDDDLRTVLLHPVGATAAAALTVASWARHRRGTVAWKDRNVNLENPA